ncbi:MAG: rRNA maturation RNase YbeY [Candidatus Magasanikbacteria bacterium]|nr:rRNA maturation RNase YbeY [Candidatus Magasanikbacteria bacterium]
MIKIELNLKVKNFLLSESNLQKLVNALSKKEKKIKGIVEVNVIGDGEMAKLNFKFRGKKYPTDVLSFVWGSDGFIPSPYLGQIYICPAQIKRQSKEMGISEKEESARMFVHGLLHLAGHEHSEVKEAKKMFGLQEWVLKNLKYVS